MLDKQRAEIDVIDREIVSLFERRMQKMPLYTEEAYSYSAQRVRLL